ncbi:CHAP domain-containing protein [Streptomyces katrae]|uniref:CHAP domain-containing protein n=1 Tax=Streptomyces katrae TaxID=68223 RepID=A0ABT7GVW6_9ACTN|nr:CHAP domain-containing protein [Streptomyces katrae]MDK9497770.1 CHAP domain-containing protein [Streptomyces katrae]
MENTTMSARRSSRMLTVALTSFVAAPMLAVALPAVSAQAESQTVASIARAQVGNTCGDYDCQYPGAWCAEFTRWVWNKAGANTSGISAAAVSIYQYGKNKGTLHSTPQVGDAVLYDKDGNLNDGEADHVNIVVAVSGDSIQTVGGNESGGVRFREWFNWKTNSSPVGAGRALAFVGPAGLPETPTTPVSQGGDLYHSLRDAGGTWTSFQPLNGFGGASFFNATQESITATPDGSTQTLATGKDGNLYHTIRYPDGTWQGWNRMDGANGAATFAAQDQALAGMPNGDAQTMAIGNNGRIYHNARYADRTWQGWNQVGDWQAKKISATGMPDGSMQSLIVGTNGNVYHNVRKTDGTWQGWFAVDGAGTAATFAASSIAIAGLPNGDAQLLAVGNDGNTWHNIRKADGTWQGWKRMDGANGATTFAASSVAIAGLPNGDAQLLAVGNDGKAWHNIRKADGTWQGWKTTGQGAHEVSLTGTPDGSAQMLITRD